MPAKFDRCVRDVKRKGSARNPYAVCNAAMKGERKMARKKHHKKHHAKRVCYTMRTTKHGKPSKTGGHRRRVCRRVRRHHR